MWQTILFILGGILVGFLFAKIRQKIATQVKDIATEKWNTAKFIDGVTDITSGKKWGQTLSWWFNFRNWIIIAIIVGSVYGYGVYQGKLGKAVFVDIGYGREAKIKLDGHYLHIDKQGAVYVEDEKGNKIKQISVRDIPGLKKKLAPIGLELIPIGVMGGGISLDESSFEGGAGISFVRLWKANIESFLTNKGIYLGSSYKITDNSSLGIGAGKGYGGDNRAIFYYRWKF